MVLGRHRSTESPKVIPFGEMRKDRKPEDDAPFVLLRDVLPDLAKRLRGSLRKAGHRDLAKQVQELRVYGRCCDASPCGRFYCFPPKERQELWRKGIALDLPGVDVTVARDLIVAVETLDPEVDRALKLVFPLSDNSEEGN